VLNLLVKNLLQIKKIKLSPTLVVGYGKLKLGYENEKHWKKKFYGRGNIYVKRQFGSQK
jgi:hypothetical protein